MRSAMSGKRKISSKHQIFSFFVRFLFKLKFKDIFSLLFQCGPRDPSSSLMRSPSHFEFKTPDLKVDKKTLQILAYIVVIKSISRIWASLTLLKLLKAKVWGYCFSYHLC